MKNVIVLYTLKPESIWDIGGFIWNIQANRKKGYTTIVVQQEIYPS